MTRPLTIMVSAGEPSGDALGAGLIDALRALSPGVRIVGIGGPAMRAAGLVSYFGIEELAVVGIREVVLRLRILFRRMRQAADFALRVKPDVVVLIDSGDFHHRVARMIRKDDPSIPIVKYVSPQVWASRPGRAEGLRSYLDHILCLLPFEPAFYERYGLPATFVGHPALERKKLMTGGAGLRARLGIAPDAKILCVLPGSRRPEVRYLLPPFRETARVLRDRIPSLHCIIPTVPNVERQVREAVRNWPTPLSIVTGDADRFAAFDAADAALAASGTVTTELALAGVPMIATYRLGWLTAAIWRRLVTVPHFTIVNLVLGRKAVPEFLQESVRPDLMAEALAPLLAGGEAAQAQRQALAEAIAKLDSGESPSRRAAETILQVAAARG
ncbi:MAG: lipid-A-disaccharide synthase [Alphaproteobacteria bacterium]|nr:lipid-A-disaccharide synthase [Alphaproteobacteria bacterium]